MERVLYIAPWPASFTEKDICLLAKHFQVLAPRLPWKNKWQLPFNFIRQLIYLLINQRKCKAAFVMFGGYWSFFPALVGKMTDHPVYIILGGTDCVSFPSINYGSLRKPIQRWFIKKSYEYCTRLLPVHESLTSSINPLAIPKEQQQGVYHHFKNLTTPYTTIYNGYEIPESVSSIRTPLSFVTVAGASSAMRFRLKGLDHVVRLAISMPDAQFTIIGCNPLLIEDSPDNLQVYPFLPFESFKSHLLNATYYLQLSLSEGFPNALAEAMSFGCIPIVTPVGAMPDIVGNTGLVLSAESENWEQEIRDFCQDISEELEWAHRLVVSRIKEKFTLEKRVLNLVALLR